MYDSIFVTEEIRHFRSQVERFVKEQIVPYGDEWEESEYIPRELFRLAGQHGFFGLKYEEEYGGSELDSFFMLALAEELGKSTYGGVVISLMVHASMSSPYLANGGSRQQKEKYLRKVIDGELVAAIAMSESSARRL